MPKDLFRRCVITNDSIKHWCTGVMVSRRDSRPIGPGYLKGYETTVFKDDVKYVLPVYCKVTIIDDFHEQGLLFSGRTQPHLPTLIKTLH